MATVGEEEARKHAKKMAERKAKLKELAEKRVVRAIKCMDLCGNLASYGPTDNQAVAISKALNEALQRNVMRLTSKSKAVAAGWTLPQV